MTNPLAVALAVATAIGSGLVAGFFLAFSICVMRALGRLPAGQGIAAMQSVNVEVLNPWFITAFYRRGVPGSWHHRDPELAQAGGDLSAGPKPALSRGQHACNDDIQRSLEQRAGGRGPEQCRGR
jgi:hypothetical protein